MYFKDQMLIIVAIICALVNKSDNCDCDVLQVNDPDGLIGYQNFTKQIGDIDGKPYYFSTQRYMIVWYNGYWSYHKYNAHLNKLETNPETTITTTNVFSFENMCKNVTQEIEYDGRFIFVNSQCMSETRNSTCSATQKLTWKFENGLQRKLKAKNPCQFPFIRGNVTYKSCIKRNKSPDTYWCAATVNDTNHLTSWGYCSDLCPLEDNLLKPDDNNSNTTPLTDKEVWFQLDLYYCKQRCGISIVSLEQDDNYQF